MKNNEKGITLVALIITIIVMLILVTVTISVAINSDLFNKAKEASSNTQREGDREKLVSMMSSGYNNRGVFDINTIKDNLPEGVEWCNSETTTYTGNSDVDPTENGWKGCYVITDTNNKFYIDKDGSVLDEKPRIYLVYNTLYRNITHYNDLMGERDVAFDIYFLKNYNNCFMMIYTVGDDFKLPMLLQYTYNPSTGKIVITSNGGSAEFYLSEDATLITTYANMLGEEEEETEHEYNLIRTEIFEYGTSKMNTPDLYSGLYYSQASNKMILIIGSGSSAIFTVEGNTHMTSSSSLESELNEAGITIEDNKTLLYENNEYTLVESL